MFRADKYHIASDPPALRGHRDRKITVPVRIPLSFAFFRVLTDMETDV